LRLEVDLDASDEAGDAEVSTVAFERL